MMTLLKSATNGWLDYTQHGKYAALLLAAILYLGYCLWKSKAARNGGKQPLFYLYAVLITLACICPVTAVILIAPMHSAGVKGQADDYVVPGSMRLTRQSDHFLRRTVARRPRQTESRPSGGGGGSMTTSHSTGSHSGRTGKF